jgi:itaconyl-CoA hydratase
MRGHHWNVLVDCPFSLLNLHQETSMVQNVKQVGEHRYRETFGRYYEDFVVGDIYEHRPGRTVTETENTWFTLLTMNTHPLHFDAEYAKASEFGRCVIASPFTVALMVGMSVTDTSQKAIANLGWTDIKLTFPLFAGDTLYSESEVLEKRESNSRPGAGIVSIKTTGVNQDGKVVGTFTRTMLIARRGHSVEDKINY